MLPIILLFGEAGSGKDSVADVIIKDFNAVAVAMADPMKRLCASVFGFDEETLWGPSSARNIIDPKFLKMGEIAFCIDQMEDVAQDWIQDVLPDLNAIQFKEAKRGLDDWINSFRRIAAQQGGLSARICLQTLGTEWGRSIDPSMWINYAQRILMKLLAGGYKYDRRFGLTESPGQMYSYGVCTDGRFRNECLGFKAAGATILNLQNPDFASKLAAGVPGHLSEQEQKTIPISWFDYIYSNDKAKGLEAMRNDIRGIMIGFQDNVPKLPRTWI